MRAIKFSSSELVGSSLQSVFCEVTPLMVHRTRRKVSSAAHEAPSRPDMSERCRTRQVSRAIRICVRMSGARARKGGSGKNTYGVNGQVFVR